MVKRKPLISRGRFERCEENKKKKQTFIGAPTCFEKRKRPPVALPDQLFLSREKMPPEGGKTGKPGPV